jgi:hypothetical protein
MMPDPMDVDRQCTARARSGKRCARIAPPGATVCSVHGARAPQVQAAAKKRVQRSVAERAVITFGLPRDIDPFVALSEELARTNGHVLWLAEIVAGLTKEELVWGVTSEEHGSGTGQREGDTSKTRHEAQPNVWLELYHRERKHLLAVAAVCLDAGLAEREVKLAEEQGRMIAQLMQSVADDKELRLDEEGKSNFRRVVSRHLRMVGDSGA